MAVNGSVSEDGVQQEEDSAEEDDDNTARRPQSREASPPKGGRHRAPLIAIGVAVVAVVGITAVLVNSGGGNGKPKTPSTTVAPRAAGFTSFNDPLAGFSLNYPNSWTANKSNDNNVPLLLTIGGNPLDTLLVRVVGIPATVDVTNVDNIKAFTDAVVSGTGVKVLKQQSITVAGAPAYYYFYSLPADQTTGTVLVHSHFFVFPPHEMVSLTFQTIDSHFHDLAPVFDQVIASLRTTDLGTTATSTP
jgi:hypothetical protein